MPAIRPSERSSGVATVAAIVSGLAPGSDACTEMVGKSICGSAETGNAWKARMPASATPMVSSVVATGRAMNGADRLKRGGCRLMRRAEDAGDSPPCMRRASESKARYTTGVVNSVSTWLTSRPPTMVMPSGCRSSEPTPVPNIKGNALASADTVVIRIGRKRSRQAWKIASSGDLPASRCGGEREIDDHDGILLDDADQQDDADDADDAEVVAAQHQRQQRANPGRRQR